MATANTRMYHTAIMWSLALSLFLGAVLMASLTGLQRTVPARWVFVALCLALMVLNTAYDKGVRDRRSG